MYFLFFVYLIGSFLNQIQAQDNPLTPEGRLRCSCNVPLNEQCSFPPNYNDLMDSDFLEKRGISSWSNLYYVLDQSNYTYFPTYDPNSQYNCELYDQYSGCLTTNYLIFNIFGRKAFVTYINYNFGYPFENYAFTNYELTLCAGKKYCFQGDCKQKGKGTVPDYCQLIDRSDYLPQTVENCRNTFCIYNITENFIKIYNQRGQMVEGPSRYYCLKDEVGCSNLLRTQSAGYFDRYPPGARGDVEALNNRYYAVRNFSLNCIYSGFKNGVKFTP